MEQIFSFTEVKFLNKKERCTENESITTKQVVGFENTMDDFGTFPGEVIKDDKPIGNDGANMGMSIMDDYNDDFGLSM